MDAKMANGSVADMTELSIPAWIGNILSPVTIVGVVVGWFPTIAIILAIVWYSVQLWECGPVQRWRGSHRLQQLAKLKIEMARLEALELVAHPANRIDVAPAIAAAEQVLANARMEARAIIDAANAPKAAKARKR
jgi:hypothetical protein